jgi:hypothetical protein
LGAALWRQLEAELEQQHGALAVDIDVDLTLGGLCELSKRRAEARREPGVE